MRILKQINILSLLLVVCSVCGQSADVVRKGEATHVGDSARVWLSLNPEKMIVDSREVLTITPRLVAAGDSVELPSIHILGRQAYYRYIRHDNLGLIMPGDKVLWEKRRYGPFAYLERALWQPWFDRAVLKVQVVRTSCEAIDESGDKILQHPRPLMIPKQKTNATVQVFHDTISDSVTIIFPLNKTDVRPELYDNQRELDKIKRDIETVDNDPNAELKKLTIKGYASPEGPYDNNVRLARGRTDSIGAYVSRFYKLDREKIHTEYEPEDWAGLIRFVREASTDELPHRDEILEVAEGNLEPDQKEWAIRSLYPADFKYLLEHCLPKLRHTDYYLEFDRRKVVVTPPDTTRLVTHAMTEARPAERQGVYEPLRPYQALFALKTNVLFDLAMAFNGEVEIPLGRNNRWSIMGEFWKPWFVWHHNSRAYQLQVIGGELRYWMGQCRQRRPKLTGWFLGAYYAYGKYDFEWASTGDQGELNSVGATIGYSWPIHRHWNLELSGSVGWFHGPRRHYDGEFDDTHLIWKYTSSTTYVGPTKLKVSLVWLIGRKRHDDRKEVWP